LLGRLRLGFGFNCIGLVYGLLEALDGLADPFTQLRQLACSEDDQHYDKDQDQFCETKTPKHGVFLRM
jgi:hypothetical protein